MAISFKSLFRNIKDVTTGDKDLIDRKTFLGKLDIGGLRQLDRLTGGKKDRTDQLRRYGNTVGGAIGGAITGAKTGGPYGAIAGAIGGGAHGYQDKRPVTGRRFAQKVGAGAGIGYGAGSGASALGSGGSGWTLGLGSGSSAGANVPNAKFAGGAGEASTTASGLTKGSGSIWKDLLQNSMSDMATSALGGGGEQESDDMLYEKWLADMRKRREIEALERQNRQSRIGGSYA
jgi:hypothetical protein